MADVLTIIGTAIETLRKLRDLSQKIKDADTKNAIADLYNALADIKIEVAGLKEENLRLKERLSTASSVPQVRSSLELRDDVYYCCEPATGRPKGPYCPRCFDADGQLIHLAQLSGDFTAFGRWKCPNCKSHYGPAT